MLQMCWLLLTCTLKCGFVFLYSRCMLCSLCNIFGFWNLTFSVQFLGEKKSTTHSSPSSFSCVFYLDDWLLYTHLSWHWKGLCMFSCNLSPLHSSRMTAVFYMLLWQHGSGMDNFLPESALGENSPRYQTHTLPITSLPLGHWSHISAPGHQLISLVLLQLGQT